MTVTTLVALTIAVVQAFLPTIAPRGSVHLAQMAAGAAVLGLYTLCLFLPSLWLAMKVPTPYWVIPILLVGAYVLGQVAIFGLTLIKPGKFDAHMLAMFYSMVAGFIVSSTTSLWLLRRCDFELRRLKLQPVSSELSLAEPNAMSHDMPAPRGLIRPPE
jgi:hypothetical protein